MMSDLLDFCERLPEQACIFTCRIGTGQTLNIFFKAILQEAHENGYKPHEKDTIETFVYDNMHDMVEECLQSAEDEGWGIEHDTIRFFAHTIDRKPVRSKVIKKRLSFDTIDSLEPKGSIEALTSALIRMTEEVRRTLHTQTQYSDKQLKTIEKLSERNIQNEETRLELEREVMIKSLLMEMNEEEQGNETKQRGLELLGKAFEVYKSSQDSTIKQKIKETIMQDDDILNEFMQDDEIKSRIWDSFMKSKEE